MLFWYIWYVAVFAKMESTIIVPGILVNAESSRYTVQHLEGGIVQKIFVADGDYVNAGDPLVKIQDIQISTHIDSLKEKLHLLTATADRLHAEQNQDESIQYSQSILDNLDNISLQETVKAQDDLLLVDRHRGVRRWRYWIIIYSKYIMRLMRSTISYQL